MTAKEIFARKGYHATGVGDIVEKEGVARGTFYLYFKSKREIFAALLEHLYGSLMECLEPIPLDEPEQILSGLLKNLDAAENYFSSDPDMAAIIINEAISLDAESGARLQMLRERLADWLTGLIRQWQEAGILRKLPPDVVAHTFIGACRTLMEQAMVSERLASRVHTFADTLVGLFVFGLIAPEHHRLASEHMAGIERPL